MKLQDVAGTEHVIIVAIRHGGASFSHKNVLDSSNNAVYEAIKFFKKSNASFPLPEKSYSFVITSGTFNLPYVKEFIKEYGFQHITYARGMHSRDVHFFFRDSQIDL